MITWAFVWWLVKSQKKGFEYNVNFPCFFTLGLLDAVIIIWTAKIIFN